TTLSKSDLIRPANRWHSSHHSTLQAQEEMLCRLSCEPLVVSVCSLEQCPKSHVTLSTPILAPLPHQSILPNSPFCLPR
uniref:Uncharacterized protein n=1 Tax=Rhinopithecus bieti TaxID=61621 RepID=A0A2K6K8U7_RHIBE